MGLTFFQGPGGGPGGGGGGYQIHVCMYIYIYIMSNVHTLPPTNMAPVGRYLED